MNKEQYVSFKVAKLLKEKGFNIPSDTSYEDYLWQMYDENGKVHWGMYSSDWYFRITQQMACRWMREEKGTHICPVPDLSSEQFYVSIAVNVNGKWRLHANFPAPLLDEKYIKCEDAVEAALEYCLTNLI